MSAMKLNILRFWTKFVPDQNKPGEMKGVDMVEFQPIGAGGRSSNIEAVSRLSKLYPIDMAADNPAIAAAHARWAIIGPAYQAWKRGEELPTNGTPLAAWSGISQSQADALKATGLRTIEDVRDASDSVITKVQCQGARELRTAAGMFLASADKVKVTAEMQNLASENADLRDQLEELRQMIIEREGTTDEPAKRRGRPPKVSAEAAA